ncbi:MAG TPA: hypothetical protein PKX00_00040 [Opitutaceae bacterium]|jgi:hypothetical protein|nr:hypothetical protein [Opitutaceae bacterium]HRE03967.1 hypothetical protein [Opitutaceae bacterium]
MFRVPRPNPISFHLFVRSWVFLLVGLGLGGCQMGMLSSTPLTTTKFTLEQTEKLVLQDPWVQRTISSTGIQHSVLPDGKMQVVVNIKNRESGLNRVELSVAFRNADGLVDLEQTPWRLLELEGRVTQAVRFVSSGTTARNFAVRVRQAIP